MCLVTLANTLGRAFTEKLTREERRAMGQFMTPAPIAKFMAQRLVAHHSGPLVRILEPAAGGGILAAAAVEALLSKPESDRPDRIELLMYELDDRLILGLNELKEKLTEACTYAGVEFDCLICNEDFLLSDLALQAEPLPGLITIANPPFLKLNKSTDRRAALHSYAVHGQPNIYALFMAATARLTPPDGGWCFITPRSWMAGAYFRAARCTLLRHLTIDRLHAFESRTDGFEEDAVLQETVITWGSGRALVDLGSNIFLTRSQGVRDLATADVQALPVERVVSSDEHAMFSLPSSHIDPFEGWNATLETYGLTVSTGRVIAFRAKEHIREFAERSTVPLLWLQHIGQQNINWPIQKKREHIRVQSENEWMMVPNAPMVVMRRFSPKEDVRRVTCSAYLGNLPGKVIGLENHLNYIYRKNGTMTVAEARGIAAYLASNVVDNYLRALAGSTQINAGELRKLPLPSLGTLIRIGETVGSSPSLATIDHVINNAIAERPGMSAGVVGL